MSIQHYSQNHDPRNTIIGKFHYMLKEPPDKKRKQLCTFYRRMLRDMEHIFTFLFFPEVPPDNNASERAIRNAKLKQKVSGQFKTEKAAQNFAKIRSVIDTIIKNRLKCIGWVSQCS